MNELQFDIMRNLGYCALISAIGGPLTLILPPASAFLVFQLGNYRKVITTLLIVMITNIQDETCFTDDRKVY